MNCEAQLTCIRVLVVDDHDLICEGLSVLLERQVGTTVVGTASTGKDAVSAAERLVPDVVIMDLMLPEMNGIDATDQILRRNPLTQVIALSFSRTTGIIHQVLRAGARGYVVKDSVSAEICAAVQIVHAGKYYLSSGLDPSLLEDAFRQPSGKSPMERLSLRERDVLHWIIGGASSADIADHLSLSPKTVDTYRSRLMVKLGVSNRSALIQFALENDFLTTSVPPLARARR